MLGLHIRGIIMGMSKGYQASSMLGRFREWQRCVSHV